MGEIFSGRILDAGSRALAPTIDARGDTAEILSAGRIGQAAVGAVTQESLAGRLLSFQAASQGAINNLQSARDILSTAADVYVQQDSLLRSLRDTVALATELTTSDLERGFLDGQFQQGLAEIEALVFANDFDGRDLLGVPGTPGSPAPIPGISLEASVLNVQAGIDIFPEDNLALIIPFGTLESLAIGLSSSDILSQASSAATLTTIDTAIQSVGGNLSLVEGQSRRIDAALGVNATLAFNAGLAADRLLSQDQTLDILDFAEQELTLATGIEANGDLTRQVIEAIEEFSRLIEQVTELRRTLDEGAPQNQGVVTAPIGPRFTEARLTGAFV